MTEERVETSAGADTISVDALAPTTIVDAGDGNDTITISALTPNATLIASGGNGADRINLLSAAAGDTYDIHGGEANLTTPTLASGTADDGDTVYVAGAGISANVTLVDLHGDLPNAPLNGATGDTLLFDRQGYTLTPGVLTFPTGSARAGNFGTVVYDTFESVPTFAPPVLTVNSPAPFNEGTAASTFTASVVPNGSTDMLDGPIEWDISGHGDFGEASGPTVTLTWQQLEAFGITGPGTYQIKAEATNTDGLTVIATGELTVLHVNPVITLTGASTIPVGETYTLGFTAAEAGNEQIEQWTVAWGDGTTSMYGADVTSATHVFTTPGADTIKVSLADSYSVANNLPELWPRVEARAGYRRQHGGEPGRSVYRRRGQCVHVDGLCDRQSDQLQLDGQRRHGNQRHGPRCRWRGRRPRSPPRCVGTYTVTLTANYSDGEKATGDTTLTVGEHAARRQRHQQRARDAGVRSAA